MGRGFPQPSGGDPLGLHSLGIEPSLSYPPVEPLPPPSQNEDDGGTDDEKETQVDQRSEAGETSSSVSKRRAEAESEAADDDDDDDSERPKKVSKKTSIACNFCRGEHADSATLRLSKKYNLRER